MMKIVFQNIIFALNLNIFVSRSIWSHLHDMWNWLWLVYIYIFDHWTEIANDGQLSADKNFLYDFCPAYWQKITFEKQGPFFNFIITPEKCLADNAWMLHTSGYCD